MKQAPAMAVVGLLNGITVNPPAVTLTAGVNVFRSYIRAAVADGSDIVPQIAVFVLCTGGSAPVFYKAGTPTERSDWLTSFVSVVVRMEPNRFGDGEDLARGVWRQLHRNVPPDYSECVCTDSEPAFAGLDDTEHPTWEIKLKLQREE